MTKRLIAYVHVDGQAYGPGDKLPAAVAKRIGAHAFASDVDEGGREDQEDLEISSNVQRTLEVPPRSGRGSGVEAWRDFLSRHEIAADPDATRDDLIAAAEQSGLIEPEPPQE
ncbi:hypothetical protein AB4225_06095 [Streptomyces sp. 2RAF24]|uniref:hypothetical protein n=1 Tax=Streptomyces sp. 2RAF24 TaxID=3232997 RepID=UPI003F9A133F